MGVFYCRWQWRRGPRLTFLFSNGFIGGIWMDHFSQNFFKQVATRGMRLWREFDKRFFTLPRKERPAVIEAAKQVGIFWCCTNAFVPWNETDENMLTLALLFISGNHCPGECGFSKSVFWHYWHHWRRGRTGQPRGTLRSGRNELLRCLAPDVPVDVRP